MWRGMVNNDEPEQIDNEYPGHVCEFPLILMQ